MTAIRSTGPLLLDVAFLPSCLTGMRRVGATSGTAGQCPIPEFAVSYAKVIPRSAGQVHADRQSPVAQLAEQPTVNRQVPGSSPGGGATSHLTVPRVPRQDRASATS